MHLLLQRWQAACCGLLLMLLAAGQAQAQSSVLIWPIDPVLEADQQASALWLENRGSEVVSLQIRVFGWSQDRFEDQYQNQRVVIGSPPLARIEPGQKQLVRLTRIAEIAPGTEQAFRIIIDEIPEAKRPESAAGDLAPSAAIQFKMRYSVPLFAYGEGLRSKAERKGSHNLQPVGVAQLSGRQVVENGRSFLEIENTGVIHARLSEVLLKQQGQLKPLADGLLGYVLPGAVMRWPLPASMATARTLQWRVNGVQDSLSIELK